MTSELEKIRDSESARLTSLTDSLTPSSDDSPEDTSSPSLKDKITGALTGNSSSSKDQRSNASVSKEVAELRAKLERRRKMDAQDPAVEKAKEDLVQCLRLKDRRPLDCWEEVEGFKREVAKLEQKFVDRALR